MIDRIEQYVRAHYAEHFSPAFTYHNVTHTVRVVQAASILCDQENLEAADRFEVLAAAWFHDAGYFRGTAGHEAVGASLAEDFLGASHGRHVEAVKRLIMATSIDHQPIDLQERILRDSDLHYLGQTTYFDHADLLRREWENLNVRQLTTADWYRTNIHFFEQHVFYTAFAQQAYGPTKRANLSTIRKKLSQLEAEQA